MLHLVVSLRKIETGQFHAKAFCSLHKKCYTVVDSNKRTGCGSQRSECVLVVSEMLNKKFLHRRQYEAPENFRYNWEKRDLSKIVYCRIGLFRNWSDECILGWCKWSDEYILGTFSFSSTTEIYGTAVHILCPHSPTVNALLCRRNRQTV